MSAFVLPSSHGSEKPRKPLEEVIRRSDDLIAINDDQRAQRSLTKAIMNGGRDAVRVLVGDEDDSPYVPAANLMLSGLERQAQRLGVMPSTKVDPPESKDSKRERDHAERREQAIETYDDYSALEMQQPQAARWMMGYGFVPYVVSDARAPGNGEPFPHISIRDPYGCSPAPWGIEQQPQDLVFQYIVDEHRLKEMYPGVTLRPRTYHKGGVLLHNGATTAESGWANPSNTGIEVREYMDVSGRYLFIPEAKQLLEFIPTPRNVPRPFHVVKRFAFDKLTGQFDHVIGLMSMMARLNILSFISTHDAVFRETNVYGDLLDGEYQRGRFAVNHFTQGTRVERPNDASSFEAFQQIDRIERHLRLTGLYPVTDDAQSPNSFVTGQGLRELTTSSETHDREYWLAMGNGLRALDEIRLRWDEARWPQRKRPTIAGTTYTPAVHIKGRYRTRRVYGVMAGLDSNAKTIGLLNLGAAGYLDEVSVIENLDGVDNVQKVLDRLRAQRAEETLRQAMMATLQGQPMDPKVLQVLVAQLPSGDLREMYENIFFAEAEAPLEQAPAVPEQPPALAQPGDSTSQMLARLTASGSGASGVQTVSEA